jgi:hypothetical protein
MDDLVRDALILRFDGVVVELFLRSYAKSLRVPAAWLGVQVKPGKHDFVRLFFGTINAGSDLYGPGVTVLGDAWPIDTNVADEPGFRDYFTKIATATGRTVAP